MKPSECLSDHYKVDSIRSLLWALDRLVWHGRQHTVGYIYGDGEFIKLRVNTEIYKNWDTLRYDTEKRKYVHDRM